MNKKYCIMDMDGTLIDSMVYWSQLGYEFLKSKGVKGDISQYLHDIEAMTLEQSAAYFKEKFMLNDSVKELHKQMNDMIINHYIYDIPLKDYAKEYLELLRNSDTRLCIATASEKEMIERCLERLGVRDMFDFVISCEEVGFGKESPAVFNKCAEYYNVPNSKIAVYDDALFAIKTAKAAGFYTVGIYDEYSSEWSEMQLCADEYYTDWKNACLAFVYEK